MQAEIEKRIRAAFKAGEWHTSGEVGRRSWLLERDGRNYILTTWGIGPHERVVLGSVRAVAQWIWDKMY